MMRKSILGPLSLFAITVIWGTSFVVLKTTLEDSGVLWVLAIRFCISSLVFLLICCKKIKKIDKDTIKGGILLGITLSLAYIFQTYGLKYTTPGKNAFLTATYCVFVPFFSWFFNKRKPTGANIIAAFLCFAGIGFITLSGNLNRINTGDVLTLVCGVFYALLIILFEEYSGKTDVVLLSTVEFAACAVIFLLCAFVFEPFSVSCDSDTYLKILYLAIFCSALCFFLQAWGQQYTSSALASVILPFESVFGALFSYLFYGEQLSSRFILGAILIIAAVFINES